MKYCNEPQKMEHLIWSYNKLVSVVSFPNKIFVKKEWVNKGNNKITELRTILQRESQNS
jgi:hypothetical protein